METQVPSCYRHPDRPGGIVCQRCDRPICTQCMHQASVGFHCPECVKAGSQQVYQGLGALVTRPVLTQALIIANVAVFLIGVVLSGSSAVSGSITDFQINFALVAKGFDSGSLVGVGEGQWWRMITSGFLHYGIFHIAVNMYALWILGRAIEQFAGRTKLAWIYGLSMLTGSVGALVLSPTSLTAGASGAIFGLMGAMFLAHRSQGVPFRESPLLGILVLNLVITLGVGGISIGGHLGGLVGGAFAGWLFFVLPQQTQIKERALYAISAAVCLAMVVAGVIVASNVSQIVLLRR